MIDSSEVGPYISAKWVHFITVVAHITHRFSRRPIKRGSPWVEWKTKIFEDTFLLSDIEDIVLHERKSKLRQKVKGFDIYITLTRPIFFLGKENAELLEFSQIRKKDLEKATDLVDAVKGLSTRECAREKIINTVEQRAKAYGKIDLNKFANDNLETIQRYSGVSDTELATEEVRKLIENLISSGILPGIISDDNLEYLDRDLIEKRTKIVNVSLQMDFNNLLQQLGNKGINLSAIQCPQCGSSNSIPNAGSWFNCEFCQTKVKVTDIFEKFKDIIR